MTAKGKGQKKGGPCPNKWETQNYAEATRAQWLTVKLGRLGVKLEKNVSILCDLWGPLEALPFLVSFSIGFSGESET